MFGTVFFTLMISTSIIECHPTETKTQDQPTHKVKGSNEQFLAELDDAKSDEENIKRDEHDVSRICLTKECIEASHRLFKHMDLTADPCQDFNQFSCGNFIENELIPDDKASYGTWPNDILIQRGRALLEQEDDEESYEVDKMTRRFYKTCINETMIEKLGVQPLLDSLKTLGGWPVLEGDDKSYDSFKWYDQTYLNNREGFPLNHVINQYIGTDDKNNTNRVWKLDQPSLGMSRENLIKGFEDKDVLAYYQYMIDAAVLLGANETNAIKQLKRSLMFEMALANLSTPMQDRRDPNQKYNPTTVGDLDREQHKAIEPAHPPSWQAYLQRLITDGIKNREDINYNDEVVITKDEKIIIEDPSFFKNVTDLLIQTNPKVVANYMIWRIVESRLNYLNKNADEIKHKFLKATKGLISKEPKWKKCVHISGFDSGSYSSGAGAAGSMYIRTYFTPEAKKEMFKMIKYIRASFRKIVDDLSWMDDATKIEAKEKLNKMGQYIAYPEEIIEKEKVDELHEGLEARGNYYDNILERDKFWSAFEYRRFRQNIDPTNWIERQGVAWANAFYNKYNNSMVFPAGILQGVFFNDKVPKYMNFGAIGGVIGHEMTHGFDDKGRKYDYQGYLKNWWSNNTDEEYVKRAQCIINQYGNYTVEQVGRNLDGINTQGENIADNGGIKQSYRAYVDWLKDQKIKNKDQYWEEQKLPGHDFTAKQLFWISWGQVWCSKYRDSALKKQIQSYVHSPGAFRILGPLSNNDDFSKDFNCLIGSPMNPKNKCSVW